MKWAITKQESYFGVWEPIIFFFNWIPSGISRVISGFSLSKISTVKFLDQPWSSNNFLCFSTVNLSPRLKAVNVSIIVPFICSTKGLMNSGFKKFLLPASPEDFYAYVSFKRFIEFFEHF